MGNFGWWFLGIILGAVALWGVMFIAPVASWLEWTHDTVRSWGGTTTENESASNTIETTIALNAVAQSIPVEVADSTPQVQK